MQSKNEQPSKLASPPFVQTTGYRYLWNTLNFTTIALTTSAAVVAVQSPIRTLLVNFAKTNVLIPSYRGGMLGLVRALYAGTQASLSGSTIRTAYISKTKSNKPTDDEVEELIDDESELRLTKPSKAAYIMEAALGIVAVTQIPAQLSDYAKSGLIPPQFKWHSPYNIYQLMSASLLPKYGASVINLSSLCLIEQKYSEQLTWIEPNKIRFVSGALSGLTAALLNYPLAAFVDHTQSQTRVEGEKIVNKGVLSNARELNQQFWAAPKSSTVLFLKHASKQLPLRMVSTASVFSIVAGVSNFLGAEPLIKVVPPEYIPPLVPSRSTFFKPAAPMVRTMLEEEEIERMINYLQ